MRNVYIYTYIKLFVHVSYIQNTLWWFNRMSVCKKKMAEKNIFWFKIDTLLQNLYIN